jgi:hypothetical protein
MSTGLGGDLELSRPGNLLDRVQSLQLARVQRGQALWARVGIVANKWRSAEVHNHSSIVMEEDWPALKLRAAQWVSNSNSVCNLGDTHGERPIGAGQNPEQIWAVFG